MLKMSASKRKAMDGVELRWFSDLLDDLLQIHLDLYGDIIDEYFNGGTIK